MLDKIHNRTYNYGWRFRSATSWWHTGSLTGFNNYLLYDRGNNIRIILLGNSGTTGVRDVLINSLYSALIHSMFN